MVETKTLSQIADEVGISANTIKTWLHQLEGIPAEKDRAGRWRFPPEAEEVLRQIQALRLDGRTMNTVRRRLSGDSTTVEQGHGEHTEDVHQEVDEHRSTVDTEEIAAVVSAAVVQAIQAQTEQAEKYAKATFTIGELQERVRGLEGERERLARELAEAKQQIAMLEAPKEPPRPWWKLWG